MFHGNLSIGIKLGVAVAMSLIPLEVIDMWMRSIVLFAAFASVAAAPRPTVRAQDRTGHDPRQLVDEAWQVIDRDFVDPTFGHHDWPGIRQEILSKKYKSTEEAHAAIARMLKELDEPQTRIMSPAELAGTPPQLTREFAAVGFAQPLVL